jgi:beta-alanine--pyruvate transaminase
MQGDNDQLASFWMPFTANRSYKAHPRQLVAASGMYYQSGDGRRILDGTSGLWCSNAGHCRPEIAEAIAKAAKTLDFAPTFQLGHPLPFELAQRLAALMPEGLDRIFFTNSGSESVDTALKIALAVQRAKGQGTRTRLIGRERGYHGVGFGGISVGGIVSNRRTWPGLPGTDHLRHTHDLARNAFTRGFPAHGAELADDLQRLVDLHGAILIFDEVITAFGRVGAATAAEAWGVTPDIITMAKGLTNAAVPMGAVAVKRDLHDAVIESVPGGIELFHGYTYSGHPLASAAGLATLDLYAREGLFERANELAGYWEDAAHSLKGRRHIIDIRTIGLVAGIELEPRPGAPTARAMELFHAAFDSGLLVRATGDIIALSPPLIVEKAEIDAMFGQLAELLDRID